MGVPQIILTIIYIADLLANAFLYGAKEKSEKDFWGSVIVTVIIFILLIQGGFFR